MIHLIAHAPNPDGGATMTFKLTKPTYPLPGETDGELGEFLPERIVQLGLGGVVFRKLGYRWSGGTEDRFWYTPVERDRFKNGPLYYTVKFDASKKITSVRQILPNSLAPGAPAIHYLEETTDGSELS